MKKIEKSWKILVMDDELIIREIAEEMLKRLGYEAHLAEDGKRALKMFEDCKGNSGGFDAVILDLTVPGSIGGIEILQKLKEIDPDVKAIISSGYSHDSAVSEFEKHGFSGAAPKPYRTDQLEDVLLKVLGIQK